MEAVITSHAGYVLTLNGFPATQGMTLLIAITLRGASDQL
jgi:hypothetical protein